MLRTLPPADEDTVASDQVAQLSGFSLHAGIAARGRSAEEVGAAVAVRVTPAGEPHTLPLGSCLEREVALWGGAVGAWASGAKYAGAAQGAG
jgi:hypothetical protein